SISPPQGSPTSHASESAIPKCTSWGGSPRITPSAISTTAPSTQPPETPPAISPRSLIAIFAPGARGADRRTSTTVASAIRSPRSLQLVTSSSTSRIALHLLEDRGELLERGQRIARQELVGVGHRGAHAPSQRLEV